MINSRNWKCVRLEGKTASGTKKIPKMEIRSSNLRSCMHLSIKSRTFLLLSSPQATGAAERKKLTNAKLNSIISWNANWIKFRIWFNQLIFIPQSHPVLFIFALRNRARATRINIYLRWRFSSENSFRRVIEISIWWHLVGLHAARRPEAPMRPDTRKQKLDFLISQFVIPTRLIYSNA